jgi:cephalosporin-C deacetylase
MKAWRAIAVCMFLAAQCLADAPPTTLRVATDREQAIYHRSESVTFRITAPAGAKVRYQLTKDGWGDLGSEETDTGQVTASLNDAGVIRCEVMSAATTQPTTQPILAGAAIDPEMIAPSMPAPEDFNAFWERQKESVASEAAKSVVTAVKSPDAKVVCFDVQINCPGGAPVSGYLALPKDAKAKSLPAILYPHSAGVRDSDLPHAVKGARMGLIAFDFNAHGLPNGQPKKFYDDLAGGRLKGYPGFGVEDRETVYFLGMFLRLLRALGFLTQQPQWDGKTLIVEGSSQGGGQALVAAGLDHRVTLCLASVPALCDHTGFVVNRTPGWPRIVPKDEGGKYSTKATQAARYFDAMNFAPRIECPTYVTVGFIDRTCPATSVYAAYNNIPATTAKHIISRPAMGHTFPPDLIAHFDQIIAKHVESMRQAPGPRPAR